MRRMNASSRSGLRESSSRAILMAVSAAFSSVCRLPSFSFLVLSEFGIGLSLIASSCGSWPRFVFWGWRDLRLSGPPQRSKALLECRSGVWDEPSDGSIKTRPTRRSSQRETVCFSSNRSRRNYDWQNRMTNKPIPQMQILSIIQGVTPSGNPKPRQTKDLIESPRLNKSQSHERTKTQRYGGCLGDTRRYRTLTSGINRPVC